MTIQADISACHSHSRPGLSHLKLPEPGYELDEVIVIPSSALELAAH